MKKLFKIALALLLVTSLAACGSTGGDSNGGDTDTPETHELQMGAAYHAAHGKRGFASAVAVVEGDTVVLAFLDEYQVVSSENYELVPNSEHFVDNFEDPTNGFGSKRVNNEAYSAGMAANGGSTVEIAENYNAIQEFVVGKTLAELQAIVDGTDEEAVDAVTGATVVDARGYIATILLAAEAAQNNAPVTYEGSLETLKLGQVDGAPHGTHSFSVTTALTDGDKVVLAYIDEFQFMSTETTVGVPNSENYAILPENHLVSKRVNTEVYSANMAEKAGSTVAIDANYDAIQAFVSGQTVAELEALVAKTPEEVVDAVTGATVVDASNYIAEIIKAATSSK